MAKNKSNTVITIVTCILLCVLALGMLGVILQVFTPYKPTEWFEKELVATTEDEMSALLVEENVGKSVRYTGETVNEVVLPISVGDPIDSIYIDTTADITTFLINLDWKNANINYSEVDGDYSYGIDVFILAITGDAEISDFTDDVFEYDSPEIIREHALLWVYREWGESSETGEREEYIHIRTFLDETEYYNIEILNGEVEVVESMFNEIFNGGKFANGNSFEITYLNPVLMSEDCLFIGVENGEYGSVNPVYVKDTLYTIEKAEDGTIHFVPAK